MFWCWKTVNRDNTALSFLPQRSKSVVGVLGDVLLLNKGLLVLCPVLRCALSYLPSLQLPDSRSNWLENRSSKAGAAPRLL